MDPGGCEHPMSEREQGMGRSLGPEARQETLSNSTRQHHPQENLRAAQARHLRTHGHSLDGRARAGPVAPRPSTPIGLDAREVVDRETVTGT